MSGTLAKRLKTCLRDGNLTVADLARWFERPYPTIRGWLNGGAMRGPTQDRWEVLRLLDAIEQRIAKRKGFPVPRLPAVERIRFIAQIRASVEQRPS